MELVGAARAALLGHQPGDPRGVELRLGVVVGGPREPVLLGGVRHRGVIHHDAAQQLVLHLHEVARVEELARLKLRIADFLGGRVQRALGAQGHGFRIGLGRHRDLQAASTRRGT